MPQSEGARDAASFNTPAGGSHFLRQWFPQRRLKAVLHEAGKQIARSGPAEMKRCEFPADGSPATVAEQRQNTRLDADS